MILSDLVRPPGYQPGGRSHFYTSVGAPTIGNLDRDGRGVRAGVGVTGSSAEAHGVCSALAVDLGHDYVLTHAGCNGSKVDRLAAPEHLACWYNWSDRDGDALAAAFAKRVVMQDRRSCAALPGGHWVRPRRPLRRSGCETMIW